MDAHTPDLDVLTRPGGNDRVVDKKALLALLAREEEVRLGIAPDAGRIRALGAEFLDELGLHDGPSIAAWLAEAGLSAAEFEDVMADLASVLAVQAHHHERLAARAALHRRLIE